MESEWVLACIGGWKRVVNQKTGSMNAGRTMMDFQEELLGQKECKPFTGMPCSGSRGDVQKYG